MTPTLDSKTSEARAQARVDLWLKVLNELADGRKAGVITPVEQARFYDAIYPMIDTPTLERLIAAMESRQA